MMDLQLKPNSAIQAEGARAPDTGLQAPAQAKEVTASDTGRTQAEGAKAPDTGSHTHTEVTHTMDVESGSSMRGHQDSGTHDPSAAKFQLDKAARKRAKRQRQKAQKRLESLAIQPRSAHTAETAEKGEDAVLPRKRPHGSTPGSVKKPPMKVARTGPPSFATATKKDLAVYVGPVEGEGPITPREYDWFMQTLKGLLLGKDSTVAVKVESCTLYNGNVRVICANSVSLDWIKAEAKKLVPKPEHNRSAFWVRGPGDLPPTRRYTVWVPINIAANKAEFYSLLKSSNPDLRIGGIHFVLETQRKGSDPSKGKLYVLAVEEAVRKQLDDLDNRPFCGMGRVTFRSRGKAPGSLEPPEARPAESTIGGGGITPSESMEVPEADQVDSGEDW